jgi:hypothetical protein
LPLTDLSGNLTVPLFEGIRPCLCYKDTHFIKFFNKNRDNHPISGLEAAFLPLSPVKQAKQRDRRFLVGGDGYYIFSILPLGVYSSPKTIYNVGSKPFLNNPNPALPHK